jgi:hypothetical protein
MDRNKECHLLPHTPGSFREKTDEVLDFYYKLMERLTNCALAHMKKLARSTIPEKPWKYEIALKGEHIMPG